MRGVCRKCSGPIPAQSGRSRPRVYCATCRPSRKAAAGTGKPVSEIRPGASATASSLVEATERQLRGAGLLDDPVAIVALELARSIAAGGQSGASMASLAREFRAALGSALAEAAPAARADDDGVSWDVG